MSTPAKKVTAGNSQARGRPLGRADRSAWYVAAGGSIFRLRCRHKPTPTKPPTPNQSPKPTAKPIPCPPSQRSASRPHHIRLAKTIPAQNSILLPAKPSSASSHPPRYPKTTLSQQIPPAKPSTAYSHPPRYLIIHSKTPHNLNPRKTKIPAKHLSQMHFLLR